MIRIAGFTTLMNAFSIRRNHNRSANAIKETKKLYNSPVNLEYSAKGGKTAERAHAIFICYNTAADWLDFEYLNKGFLIGCYLDANQPWIAC